MVQMKFKTTLIEDHEFEVNELEIREIEIDEVQGHNLIALDIEILSS